MRCMVFGWVRRLFGYNEEESYIKETRRNLPKEDQKLFDKCVKLKKENLFRINTPTPAFKEKDPCLLNQDFSEQTETDTPKFRRLKLNIPHVSEPSNDPSFTDEIKSSDSSDDFIESEIESLGYGSDMRKKFGKCKAEILEYMKEHRDANYDLWTTRPFTQNQEKICEEAFRLHDWVYTIKLLTEDKRLRNLTKQDIVAWVAWNDVRQLLAK